MRQKLFILSLIGIFFADSLIAQMPRPPRPQRPQRHQQTDSTEVRERRKLPPYEGGKFRNTIRIYPLTNFDAYLGGGISFERQLDANGNISFILPFYFGVGTSSSPFVPEPYFLQNGENNTSALFINPGIKLYPGGQGRVTYAIGVSAFMATGTVYVHTLTNPTYGFYEKQSIVKAGLLVNNYLQFNVSNHVNFGMELGVGPSYLNRVTYEIPSATVNYGIKFFGQAAFHIGYKF